MLIQSIQKRVYTLDVFMHRMLVSESYQPCENQALELQSLRWWIPWDAIGIQFYQLLLKLLLLSHFSRVRLCATPETAAHQAPPSLGFSRQEHLGCHFLLQCMKVKSESEVAQLCPTLHDPTNCSPPGPSIHGIFQARVLEWSAIAFSSSLS